ncbi:MAG: ShlB/FhaC/HecB family hemolysin secretion/activation protein [Pseudomonadota bacterium]
MRWRIKISQVDAARAGRKRVACGCAALLAALCVTAGVHAESLPVTSEVTPAVADNFSIFEFRVLGNTQLPVRVIEEAVYPLLGEQRSFATVEQARDALVAAYRTAGLGTVLVDIPEQSVDDGIVRLQVTEGRIEKVRISGARYYSERRILARLPSVKAGEVPKLTALQAQLTALAGEARDREITPTLKPGSTPGTLAVEFGVKDHLPLHASLEANNRYTSDTTQTRLVASISYENMFQRADTLGLQYQTAPQKMSEVQVGALSYLGHTNRDDLTWSGYAIRSKSDVAAIGTLSVIGNGTIVGLRINHSFGISSTGAQTLSFGPDWKDFGEDIRLSTNVSARTPIHYLLWTAQHGVAYQVEKFDVQNQLGVSLAIRGLATDDKAFAYKRSGAHAGFAYLRDNSSATWRIGRGWALGARLGLQYSEQPLISNEQLALGGVDSVRGYLDAEALVDSGVAATLELRSPTAHLRSVAVSGMVFYDRGVGMMQQPLSSEISSGSVRTDLSGWGVGMRFAVGQALDAMIDWSTPVVRGTRTRAGDGRIDFNLKLTF